MSSHYEIIFLTFLLASFCKGDIMNIVELNDLNHFYQLYRNTNMCRYRESPYPESVFAIHSSWGCYRYTRDDMFVGGVLQAHACTMQNDNQTYGVPGILVNEDCIPFRHTSEEIIANVMRSFQNELIVRRWIDCSEDALSCCKSVLHQYDDEENTCPPTWDAWTCYSRADAGSKVKKQCSPYSYIAHPPRCLHQSYKECFTNGSWNTQTDYSTCSVTPRLISRTNWHTAMLSMSIIIATPAIFLLILYEGQQFQKFKLIRNLIVAIVMRNILVLISKQVIIMEEMTETDETIMSRNEWACKLLAFFEKLATNLVFACMLLEGIFLHQLLTNVFSSRGQSVPVPAMLVYYIVAFGVSIIAAIAWACVMAFEHNEFCWLVTDSNQFHWINDAPKLVMLITCTVLLCHIIFNIWNAFINQTDIQQSAIRTAKASILCMPLFGIPFLFFIGRPDTDSCEAEQVYYFFSYAFEGLQGVFVAILHCFTDKEILRFYTPKFRSLFWRISQGDSKSRRQNDDIDVTYRRDTACTVVGENQATDSNSATTEINSNIQLTPTG